jgi:hypothetical protein
MESGIDIKREVERFNEKMRDYQRRGLIHGYMLTGGILNDVADGRVGCNVFLMCEGIGEYEQKQVIEGIIEGWNNRSVSKIKRENVIDINVPNKRHRDSFDDDGLAPMEYIKGELSHFPEDKISAMMLRRLSIKSENDIIASGSLGMFMGCYYMLEEYFPEDVITLNLMIEVAKMYMELAAKRGRIETNPKTMIDIFVKMAEMDEIKKRVTIVSEEQAIINTARQVKDMINDMTPIEAVYETCDLIMKDLCIKDMSKDDVFRTLTHALAVNDEMR